MSSAQLANPTNPTQPIMTNSAADSASSAFPFHALSSLLLTNVSADCTATQIADVFRTKGIATCKRITLLPDVSTYDSHLMWCAYVEIAEWQTDAELAQQICAGLCNHQQLDLHFTLPAADTNNNNQVVTHSHRTDANGLTRIALSTPKTGLPRTNGVTWTLRKNTHYDASEWDANVLAFTHDFDTCTTTTTTTTTTQA